MVAAGMQARARLSEDATRAALNFVEHASEHCAIDRESLRVLGSAIGRQVLVRRSPTVLALYSVAARADVAAPALQVGTVGLARLRKPTAPPPPTPFEVTVETDFVGSGSRSTARLSERVLGESESTSGLAVLAPHGGRIEVGTDHQATRVYEILARERKPVRAWIAEGFNSATGAHTCWHITATEISERSFPGLGSLFDAGTRRGPFAHAVAFHGQNDTEDVVVGGGRPRDRAHTMLKARLAARIADALRAVTDDPPAVVVRPSGPLAGAQQRNIVNRVTAAGNGIQLEQPPSVRDDEQQRDVIAEAVAAFYAELLPRSRAAPASRLA